MGERVLVRFLGSVADVVVREEHERVGMAVGLAGRGPSSLSGPGRVRVGQPGSGLSLRAVGSRPDEPPAGPTTWEDCVPVSLRWRLRPAEP